MATPVYGMTLPGPIGASFPPGTLGLSVAPQSSGYLVSGKRTYYLARYVALTAGVHRMIAYADNAASIWFGNSANEVRMVGSTELQAGPTTFEFFVPRTGQYRIDIILQNIEDDPSLCYAALAILQAGVPRYVSTAADWLQFSAQIADAELLGARDERLAYPVFSVLPNWKGGVLERVEYSTEVMSGETDDEQRRSVRQFSKRSFETSFLRQGTARARLDTFISAVGRQMVLLPLWHEQHYIITVMPAGSPGYSFPRDTLQYREFRANDLVLLTNGDPDDYEILKIESIGGYGAAADQIRFSQKPRRAWPVRSRIIPIRVAKISEQVSLSNPTDRVSQLQLRFDVMEPNNQFEADWGYCVPLFQLVPNRAQELGVTIDRTSYVLPNNSGFDYNVEPGGRAIMGQRLSVMLKGRQQIVAHRKFMEAARGRARAFYMPTFTHDLEPVGQQVPSGDYIDIKPSGYAELMKVPQRSKLWIAIVFRDDSSPLYRQITSAEVHSYALNSDRPSVERLYLNKPLPGIARLRIARIMFLVPSRFDQDTFEISHPTDDARVAVAALVSKSVDQELGDIDCWVTSRPYPVIAQDRLQTGSLIVSGRMYDGKYNITEAISSRSSIVEGKLRSLLSAIEQDDQLATSSAVVSGTLRQVLRNVEVPVESLNSTSTLAAGTLVKILISYFIEVENLNSSSSIISGSLS